MEWAVYAASSDSEDAMTEKDDGEWAVCAGSSNSEDSLTEVAKDGAPSHTGQQGSIDTLFGNQAASTVSGCDSMNSVKAHHGVKPPPKDLQDLIHVGEKDKVPVARGMCSTLTVNIPEKDGISYSNSEHLTSQTVREAVGQELVAKEDLGEPAGGLEFSSTSEFEVRPKQKRQKYKLKRKKKSLAEDGQDQGAKLVKISEQLKKNQLSCTSTVNAKNSQEVNIGMTMYNCPECDKYFTNTNILNQHLLSEYHTKRPHKCPDCKKRFVTAIGMRNHRRAIHNVEKTFQCSECNSTFSSSGLLNRHLESHRAVDHFKCRECSRVFPDSWALRDHWHAKHLSYQPKTHPKTFKCLICNIYITSEYNLRKHWMKYHAVEEPELFSFADYVKAFNNYMKEWAVEALDFSR